MTVKSELEEVRLEIKECEEYLNKVRALEDKLVKLRYRLIYLDATVFFNEHGQ